MLIDLRLYRRERLTAAYECRPYAVRVDAPQAALPAIALAPQGVPLAVSALQSLLARLAPALASLAF